MGRIDDVLNVAGHRLGTAEIESALVSHPRVAEAAVVGRPDELKGQALVAFVTLKQGQAPHQSSRRELAEHVAKEIGSFAKPDEIRFSDALPKTRSGKIMRRLLKEIAAGASDQGRHDDARRLQRAREADARTRSEPGSGLALPIRTYGTPDGMTRPPLGWPKLPSSLVMSNGTRPTVVPGRLNGGVGACPRICGGSGGGWFGW